MFYALSFMSRFIEFVVHKVVNFMDLQCPFAEVSVGSEVWLGIGTLS